MWPAYGHEAHQATGPFTPILGPLSLSPGPPLAPTSDSSTGILQGQMKCLFFEEIFWVPHPDGHHPLSLPRPPSSLWFSCGLPLSQFLCLCSPSLVPSPPGSLSLHPPPQALTSAPVQPAAPSLACPLWLSVLAPDHGWELLQQHTLLLLDPGAGPSAAPCPLHHPIESHTGASKGHTTCPEATSLRVAVPNQTLAV